MTIQQRLIIPLLTIAVILALSSCSSHNERAKSVVVLHSWSDAAEDGHDFQNYMREAFINENINVNIHHVYFDMVRNSPSNVNDQIWPLYVDSLKRWHPDIILINDDPCLDYIFRYHQTDSLFLTTPSVFSGVNVLQSSRLAQFPLMTGFEEHIDFVHNFEIVRNISGLQHLVIELDPRPHDMALLSSLRDALRDTTRYVDNTDLHITRFDSAYIARNFPGKLVVSAISCSDPSANSLRNPNVNGKELVLSIFREHNNVAHLQVKRDLYSHTLIDLCRVPQFTAIREQFNTKMRIRFLCGYFCSVQTQVADQVSYAARILRGESPETMPRKLHRQDYYMDYNAMDLFPVPVSYRDYSDRFQIVNAPFRYVNALTFRIIVLLASVAGLSILVLVSYLLLRWRRRGLAMLMEDLMYEDKMNRLLFSKKSDTVWMFDGSNMHISDDFALKFRLPSSVLSVDHLRSFVLPESMWAFNQLLDYRNQRGRKSLRFHLSLPHDSFYWIEVVYTASYESSKSGKLYGILINIDDKKAIEDRLADAQKKSSEVALKESFLANISHDLRTPLGSITGFSSLLTDDSMELTPQDVAVFSTQIHENTDMILRMIDSIVEKSQLESGDIVLVQRPVSVTKIVRDTFLTNKVIAPHYIDFLMESDVPDCNVNVDVTRTRQVLNNFLSNAFKFTTEGSVTVGWHHVDCSDDVEIFVRDTGIGIKDEYQDKVFERFFKQEENDKGTGLGLNISKTIVEKQGGTIGVRSKERSGSTFFIRLRKYTSVILALFALCLSSCQPFDDSSEVEPKHVVVLHGYDNALPDYAHFDHVIAETFAHNGYNVDIKNFYLDVDCSEADARRLLISSVRSLYERGWNIDLVLSEGDRTASVLSSCIDDLHALRDVPVVFGSIHHPDWSFIREHSDIVPIYDPIDYCANINLAVELSGVNCVEIELDYFHQDSLIRDELRSAIARPPYVDNTDYHIFNMDSAMRTEEWLESIFVTTFSAESPERNVPKGSAPIPVDSIIERSYSHSWNHPTLAVKRDPYSFLLIDKHIYPQFTAVKAGFHGAEGRFLAGYFASYQTVGIDLANVGCRLFNGADPRSMVGLGHEKKYYMNYSSMVIMGMDYNSYSQRFVIIGAPFRYEHPGLYVAIWILSVVGVCLTAFLLVWLAFRWREQGQKKLMASILHKAEIRKLAIKGADSRTIRGYKELERIIVHIDQSKGDNIVQSIELAAQMIGNYTFEIYADIEEEGVFCWWQLRFVVMQDKKGNRRLDGILINIDDSKKYEVDLRVALELAEVAQRKENFLRTISHEIRTPLNAVVGFSDLLLQNAGELSPEEIAYFRNTITENNERLKRMIEDILMYSRVESGSVKYDISRVSVSELLGEVAEEWAPNIPSGVRLLVDNGRDDIYIDVDRAKMKFILSQLMSNAVKFTVRGIIRLSYIFNYDTDEATVLVEDTGIGLSKEKRSVVFGLFWKNDNFVTGLGLGLNVAQKMAQGMGVNIKVNSQEGYGSTFYMIIKGSLIRDNKQQQE